MYSRGAFTVTVVILNLQLLSWKDNEQNMAEEVQKFALKSTV
jgi:hypothetical protein